MNLVGLGLALAVLGLGSWPVLANWERVSQPSNGVSEAIGGPAAGCVAGALALPWDGEGFQAVRVGRRRHFGHPDLVAFVEALGRKAKAAGLADLYIGDMAQPRGGPMSFGHSSHQTGLDVDVWFSLDPKPPLPVAQREFAEMPSVLTADRDAVDRQRWRPEHVRLLSMAAEFDAVDRIFVHPVIKRELCRNAAGDRRWLRKIRPWYGHHEHFHVRLKCPFGSAECAAQGPIPAGDGCDATLDWWFQPRPPPTSMPPKKPMLPARCLAILAAE
jgi:penicillin-insensitive murein endopeptidase